MRCSTFCMQVVILYLCWIPLNAVLLVDDVVGGLHTRITFFPLLFTVCHLVAMSSAVSNPVMYGFMNENFVREARALLFCGRARERLRRTSEHSATTLRSTISGSRARASANGNGELGMRVRASLVPGDTDDKECVNVEAGGRDAKRRTDEMSDRSRYTALPTDGPAGDGDGETLAIALDDLSTASATPSPVMTNRPENDNVNKKNLELSKNHCTNLDIPPKNDRLHK